MFGSMNDDDDESFFTPISSSNLASLFGINMTPSNSSSSNTTLTYTAPKQPITKTEESPKSPAKHQSSVILFKEVHGFKLVEKQYAVQGKCGLALIGNDTVHVYQLLLYKHKNDIISTSKINANFQFIIQKDNHATYCDDQKQNWTIRFNTAVDLTDFIKALETKGVKIINNPKNDETNKAKGSDVPKVDIFKDAAVADIEPLKQIDSDNQSDSSSTNTKANILSRMAKMGQRILLPNTSISDGTDSETEKERIDNKVNRKNRRSAASPTITSTNNIADISRQTASTISPITTPSIPLRQSSHQYVLLNGQYVPIVQPPHYMQTSTEIAPISKSVLPVETVSSPILYNPAPHLTPDQLNMYFVENRTHNSEVRMNIVRLTNKIEEMYNKIQLDTTTPVPCTESAFKQENESLKSTVTALEKNIASMKAQYERDLTQRTKLLEKESDLLEKNEEQNKTIQQLLAKNNDYLKKIEQLELQVQQTLIAKSQEVNCQLETSKQFKNNEENIKKIMNELYHDLISQFNDDEMILGGDVKRILAKKIVDNTYNIIAAVNELKSAETDASL